MPNELLRDSHQRERTKARPGATEMSARSGAPLVVSGCYDSDKDRRSGGSHGSVTCRQKQISRESSVKRLST